MREWVEARKAQGAEFVLDFLPAYSPNLNLIERLWQFLCKHALQQWHATYEAMQASGGIKDPDGGTLPPGA